jgi:hypothetical protein
VNAFNRLILLIVARASHNPREFAATRWGEAASVGNRATV